jgi:hypothetical protein
MNLTDAQREQLIAAQDEWRDAEKAYREEVAKYVGAWWVGDGPPPQDKWPRRVTREARDRWERLRADADAARTAYYELAVSMQ